MLYNMELETIVVRKVNKSVYRKFKQKTVEEDTNMGEAMTEALLCWLDNRQKNRSPDPKLLLKLNGIVKTKRPVRWSEEIDKTLYGADT